MLRDRHITAFFHEKGCTILVAFLACVSCAFAWDRGAVARITGDLGLGLPSANLWIGFNWVSAVVNLSANVLAALLTVYLNRAFNVLRSLTALVASMFMAMQIASPVTLGQFYGGTVLVLSVLFCTMLLFSEFGNENGQRRVFLVFFLTGTCAFTQTGYLFYIPVLLLGCMQMRIFSLRTCLAALLGIITPAWILFGLGIVRPEDMQWPEMVVAWSMFDTREAIQAFAATGFTIIVGVGFTIANILKIFSYNSRVRAYNGFLTMVFLFTALFTLLDFNNFTFYIPLLNCMAAYQVGHFFTYRRQRRSYIAILLLMGCYAGLYAWAVS
ncbi:MAG: hypothetical protein K2L78_05680 [Muribaculaceae bacterium]|nr:hypothetical protein [Muribaculaceae bacterium]